MHERSTDELRHEIQNATDIEDGYAGAAIEGNLYS